MHEVTMPKLSDSMEEGRIIEWRVSEGDAVSEGDVLADVESDKAVMELECFRSGTVARILQGDDTEVAVGAVIAYIAEEGEEPAAAGAAEPEPEEAVPEGAAAEEAEPEPEGVAPEEPETAEEEHTAEAQTGKPQPDEVPAAPEEEAPTAAPAGRTSASPYARKLAREKGVDLQRLNGSGPDGRIVARDVMRAAGEAAAEGRTPAAAPAAGKRAGVRTEDGAEALVVALADYYGIKLADLRGTGKGGAVTVDDVVAARAGPRPEPLPPPDEELPELDVAEDEADVTPASFRMKTQARRVVSSQHVIPHFYITRGIDASALMHLKDELKERHGATLTHVIMRASVLTLLQHPEVNSSWDRGRIIRWRGVHLGLAVDTDEGLTVGVLRDAQDLSLAELAEGTAEMVERARAGKLKGEERRHPTFTITNLGMFGVEHFEPIINPPSAVTMAVASALPTAVVREDAVHIGHVMKLTLACDHRIIDGATAARFLADLREALESPGELMDG